RSRSREAQHRGHRLWLGTCGLRLEKLMADSTLGEACLVVIPTYNEQSNLRALVAAVLRAAPGAHLLVVDDASPDGTGAVADALAVADTRVHVLHRAGKRGLGSAYVDGFGWGLARDFSRFIQMDADFSHDPQQLERLVT